MYKDKEKLNQDMLERYHKRRKEAVDLLGGKCVVCGSTENLEFDHIDPQTKKKTIAKIWGYSKETFLKEINKCQLLCRKCHEEKSLKDAGKVSGKTIHGTLASRKYCRCKLCKEAYNAYMREWKRKKRQKDKDKQNGCTC